MKVVGSNPGHVKVFFPFFSTKLLWDLNLFYSECLGSLDAEMVEISNPNPETDFLNKLLGTTLLIHSSAGTVTEVGLPSFEQLRLQTLPCLSH